MSNLLIDNLNQHIQLLPQDEAHIKSIFQIRSYKKGETVVASGSVCRELYFVSKGCLRTYYIDVNGVEHNLLLHPENWWATDMVSFYQQKRAVLNISTLEKTELMVINYRALEQLYIDIPKMERFFRILYQNGFSFYQNRLINFLSRSAAERYRIFTRLYPSLEQRIAQKHIASFLGMTPVFLSILRKQEFQKT
jgi:CRP/FNR family transcriptional regulator, anaerobic regulatory protein